MKTLMASKWLRTVMLVWLAGWYGLLGCLLPLFHHCETGFRTCPLNIENPQTTQTCSHDHVGHFEDYPIEVSTFDSTLTLDDHTAQICFACIYQIQSKSSSELTFSTPIHTNHTKRWLPRLAATQTLVRRLWCTSIILRGPPSELS